MTRCSRPSQKPSAMPSTAQTSVDHPLHENRRKARHNPFSDIWASQHGTGLAAVCGPGKTAQVPQAGCQDLPETRHGSSIRGNKEHRYPGANCAIRETHGGGLQVEDRKVQQPNQQLPQTRQRGKVLSCGGLL